MDVTHIICLMQRTPTLTASVALSSVYSCVVAHIRLTALFNSFQNSSTCIHSHEFRNVCQMQGGLSSSLQELAPDIYETWPVKVSRKTETQKQHFMYTTLPLVLGTSDKETFRPVQGQIWEALRALMYKHASLHTICTICCYCSALCFTHSAHERFHDPTLALCNLPLTRDAQPSLHHAPRWQKLQWRLLAGLLRERESPQGMPGPLGLHSGVDHSAELRSM